jgi:hypothetical protein
MTDYQVRGWSQNKLISHTVDVECLEDAREEMKVIFPGIKIVDITNLSGILCSYCQYSVQEDYGYSNYTVEGTDIDCLKALNPAFPIDRFYQKEPVLEFAMKCDSFQRGDGIYIDVDREEALTRGTWSDFEYDLSPYAADCTEEIKELFRRWCNDR